MNKNTNEFFKNLFRSELIGEAKEILEEVEVDMSLTGLCFPADAEAKLFERLNIKRPTTM